MTRYGVKIKGGGGYLAPLLSGTWGAVFTRNRADAWNSPSRDDALKELQSASDWCKVPMEICYFKSDEILVDVSEVNGKRPCSI